MSSRSSRPAPIDALQVDAMAIALPRQGRPGAARLMRLARLAGAVREPMAPRDALLVSAALELDRSIGSGAALAVLRAVLDYLAADDARIALLDADFPDRPRRPWYQTGQMA